MSYIDDFYEPTIGPIIVRVADTTFTGINIRSQMTFNQSKK